MICLFLVQEIFSYYMTDKLALTDIFTDFDDTIFSDGSIDPIGLQVIWTSLGNRIFQNRLNTISTNIRAYTLNLFHHAVIQHAREAYEEKIVNLVGRPPYDNRNDLYDGIVIFLECLLAHILVRDNAPEEETAIFIPGANKLNGILINRPGDKIASSLPVDRKDGILIRHILLGIHGRHKGPFQQMGLFQKSDYYADDKLWKEIRKLFNSGSWGKLMSALVPRMDKHILSAKISGNKPIRVKVSDIVDENLESLYRAALQPANFNNDRLTHFWEHHLGLADPKTTAGKIYAHVKTVGGEILPQEALQLLAQKHDDPFLMAINAVEPFIAAIQKIMDRLLLRSTSSVDAEVSALIKKQLRNPAIDIHRIKSYLTEDFFNYEAIRRLNRLIHIYNEHTNPMHEKGFTAGLIEFHRSITRQRGNLPWITISSTYHITQHRSFQYTSVALENQEKDTWVNDYYLNTVISLYKGLYA